jgi:lipoprotein NlpI
MSHPTPTPPPTRRPRPLFWTIWLLIGVVLLGVYVVRTFVSPPDANNASSDPVGAAHANALGIAHMEQFQYPAAVAEFEKALQLAPDWRPAKINLGIALLNTQDPANLDRALELFADVLRDEPDNPYAHYCRGVILLYRNELDAAHVHFNRVVEIDPNDAHALYFRGQTRPDEAVSPESKQDYERALKLNPYLNTARYALAQHSHDRDEERSRALLTEFEQLNAAEWASTAKIEYTRMGKYAEVIGAAPAAAPETGPVPMFEHIKPAVVWSAATDDDPLRAALRERFGTTVVLLDYNRDGLPDVFIAGPRDILLRNDGDNRFTDVTAELGLDKHPGSFGATVADYDNDGWPDLTLTGPHGVRLFRNIDGQRFEDRTSEAGFDTLLGVYLGATWADLDQDGDLDLVLAKYADTPEQALKRLKGEQIDDGGQVVVFVNVGVAPPAPPGTPPPPLTTKFERANWPDELKLQGPIISVTALDIDGDRDVDLIVCGDIGNAWVVLNDRLMRFRNAGPLLKERMFFRFKGGLAIDCHGDDRSDLLLLPEDQPMIVRWDSEKRGVTDSPPLKQAHRADLDLDGRSDIVGLSHDGKPVFLQGDGNGKFTRQPEAFGPTAEKLPGLTAVAVADFDADGNPDLLALADDGLHIFRNLGNGNRGLRLIVTGKRDKGSGLRTNADAIGAIVTAHAGPLRTTAELTTLSAGLGQSRVPLQLGLGKAPSADAVRVRWPDMVVQAELDVTTDGVVEIIEIDRMPSSCPVLFTWDGRRFAYVTDILGAGVVGEMNTDGSSRPPRPEESIKIEAHQLALRDGKYLVKLTEPMDEVAYLDYLRLDVIDHPADVVVYPDERFATSAPPPNQELLAFREKIFPIQAVDHRGQDVTATLRHHDRDVVDSFARRSWLGFAEEHAVELSFPSSVIAETQSRRLFLVLAGWTEYAFPESINAATQAGVPMLPPVLEQRQPDGTWKPLGEIGFPAGLTRVMTKEVTGWIDPTGGPLRIRTNLQIYWDQIYLAPLADTDTRKVHELPVTHAKLAYTGFAQEIKPGGKPPIEYDHDRREAVSATKWKGRLTRYGDVTELLTAIDDRHVIIGPGDGVTVEFDAAGLPPVPEGWVRSFVLRTAGYCKDAALTTATGGQVGPLPYRAMPHYPYKPGIEPPHIIEYDRIWNTRPATGGAK